MNNAAVSTHAQVFVQTGGFNSLGINRGVESLGHTVVTVRQTFEETARLSPQMAAPIYLPTNKKCIKVPVSPHSL